MRNLKEEIENGYLFDSSIQDDKTIVLTTYYVYQMIKVIEKFSPIQNNILEILYPIHELSRVLTNLL